MVDCCALIQVPGNGLRLEELSDEHVCGSDKFTLYGCPSCGALWVAQDAFWDHGTWYRTHVRVASRESFEALVASARVSKAAEVPARPEPRPSTASDIARAFEISATIDREKGSKQDV